MSILKRSMIYSASSVLSKVSGFLRDAFLASFLGANILADIFFIALRQPMAFKSILTEETFNSAFIPIYNRLGLSEERERKYHFAKRILNYLVCFFIPLIILAHVFMPNIIAVLAPGIKDDLAFDQLITSARIIFPYLIVIAISSVFIGALNSDHKFALTSGLPLILNITIIIGVLVYPNLESTKLAILSWAVVLGGLLQLAFLFYATDPNFWRSFGSRKDTRSEVSLFAKLVWPSILASCGVQLNLAINMLLASFFSGAVTYLHLAQRIYWLPITVLGIAIGAVLIPKLSESIVNKEVNEAHVIESNVFYYSSILILPMALGLFLTSDLVIASLFQRGEFDGAAVSNTALVLQILSLALPAGVLVKILVPYFFAMEKPKIPMKITISTVLINLALTLVLFKSLGYIAIPTALVVSTWSNYFLLIAAHRKFGFSPFGTEKNRKLLMHLAFSVFLGVEIYWCKTLLIGQSPMLVLTICVISAFSLWVLFFSSSEREMVHYCVNRLKGRIFSG